MGQCSEDKKQTPAPVQTYTSEPPYLLPTQTPASTDGNSNNSQSNDPLLDPIIGPAQNDGVVTNPNAIDPSSPLTTPFDEHVCVAEPSIPECNDVNECLLLNGGCGPLSICINQYKVKPLCQENVGIVTTGSSSVCIITLENKLFCFDIAVGVLASVENDWIALDRFADFSCAIDTHHQLYCWGKNTFGQLGINTSTIVNVDNPTAVKGPLANNWNWKSVSTATHHACAIDTNGQLACWGLNESGQLGTNVGQIGAYTDWSGDRYQLDDQYGSELEGKYSDELKGRARPFVIPPNDAVWKQISVGGGHSCAIRAHGDLFCWGENNDGEAIPAIGGLIETPLQIQGTWLEVASGGDHTCAINTQHKLSCWGSNSFGQAPNTLPDLFWQHVAANQTDSCAIADGTVYCWGKNYGSFTTITMSDKKETNNHFEQISVGGSHACAVKDDHRFFCWAKAWFGGTVAAQPSQWLFAAY